MSIRGPGRVVIGDNVFMDGTSHAVTPWTHSKDAMIIIGNNVFLNGSRFGCRTKIEIGDGCIIADCRILGTDFHGVLPNKRNDANFVKSAPIRAGKNAWIAMDCGVLRGVTIGSNSTVTTKSVVTKNIAEYCVYDGNPAVLITELQLDDGYGYSPG